MVRLGPRDYRVECTVCRKHNVGPYRDRAEAVRRWNGRSATDLLSLRLYGRLMCELTIEEIGELYSRIMNITKEKPRVRRGGKGRTSP